MGSHGIPWDPSGIVSNFFERRGFESLIIICIILYTIGRKLNIIIKIISRKLLQLLLQIIITIIIRRMSSNNSKRDECSICLNVIDPRGGIPLSIPGCCGGKFHAPCLQKVAQAGNIDCPLCRVPLPAALLPAVLVASTPVLTGAPPQSTGNILNSVFAAPPQSPSRVSRVSAPGSIRRPLSRTADVSAFPDDPTEIPPAAVADTRASTGGSALAATTATSPPINLSLTHCNEFDPIHCSAIEKLYSSVAIKYVEPTAAVGEARAPIDCVCILDTSGSMDGSKIEELKKAMNFVVGTLNQYDRLAIVDFNSDASIVQGFSRMSDATKVTTNEKISAIRSGGGTDIYAGLNLGNQLLTQRTTKNPTSCMFLLTDGQDGANLQQKLATAKALKASGSSLFVFGFGADHDSQHLTAISNAAEGSFMFVETSDTVIDAFGGAIGSQMSGMMYNITVAIKVSEASGNSIKKVHAGAYPVRTLVPGKSYEVSFSSLFAGEARDLLLEVSLPASSACTEYPLFESSASFEVNRADGSTRDRVNVPGATNNVQRHGGLLTLKLENRNPEMDFKIQRVEATNAMEEAVRLAEAGRNTDAKAALQSRLTACISSPTKNSPKMQSLIEEVEKSMHNVERSNYLSGGRAACMESYSVQSCQRQVYSKSTASPSLFQSSSSSAVQSTARSSKPSSKHP
jgi:Mg-chelatase subunit ChlD